MILELLIFVASIFSNMVWLFLRSFTSNVADLEPADSQMNEKTDHLECNMVLMGFVESLLIPAFISWVLLTDTEHITIETPSDNVM